MNRVVFTLLLVFCPLLLTAQDPGGNYNPYVNNGIITPSPLWPVEATGTGVISFNIGNTGSDPLEVFTGQSITLTITLSNGVPDNVVPLSAIGGTSAGLFTWVYNSGTYTGTQTATIPASSSGTITIAYKVTVNSATPGSNGFNVNITPAAYQTGSNTQNDDAVSSYTYTEVRDFGDAPASYGSADHIIDFFTYMGSAVDGESANQPSASANADDTNGQDDEDGVTFPALARGATVSIPVTLVGGAYLNVWIDWNGNGTFEETGGERVASNLLRGDETLNLSVTVPVDAITSAPTFARFRFGPRSISSPVYGSTGSATYGEVEDYQIAIGCEIPTANAGPALSAICPGVTSSPLGGSVGGSATGGTWTSSAGGTFNPNPATLNATWTPPAGYNGTATLTLTTTGSSCGTATSTKTQVVNALPATPTITASGPVTFCAGGSVTLTSSAGTTYLWSTGATTAGIIVTTPGSYTVQVTNGSGCQSAASAATTVVVNALPATPTITASGPLTFCAGGSVTLTSSAGSTYLWSTGATTANIIVTTAGNYNVQVTNASGCQSALSSATAVVVNALPAAPTITASGPVTFCAGGSVTLTSSTGSTYLWSTGATSASINVTTAGSYTVQVTNVSGCQSAASAATTVTVNSLPAIPTITAGGPTTFCTGSSVILTSSAGSTYLWSTGATGASINVTTAGTYTVQVTNASGCQSAASAATTVVVNALPVTPTITASGPLTFCAGSSVTLTSGAGSTYLWSTGATTSSINVTAAGSYTVQVTNASGCQSAISAAAVTVVNALPAAPAISASGPLTFCAGGSVNLTSGAGSTYLWSTGATTAGINVTTSGSYTVQVTNANGCQSAPSAATVVVVNALPAIPTITAGGPTTFCTGSSVNLTSGTGTTYLWSTGATTASINVTTAGSYTVQVTNASGCQSASSSATIVVVNALPAAPTITASGPVTFCAGGSVTLTSSAGSTYSWSTGATSASINVSTAGSYTVRVTNGSGCQSAASAATTVVVNALPETPTITAGGPTTFCAGGSVTLISSAGTSYLWSSGATTSSINATTAGIYTVQVTNTIGCQSAASTALEVTVNALPAAPTISASGPVTFCAGGSVTLTSSAGSTYLWSTNATTAGINVTTAGSYTVRVTNAIGCQSVASAAIGVTVNPLPAAPTITASGPLTFCAGGSVTLTSSAGSAYLWSTGAATASINATAAGSYTVQVTNANGCQSAVSAATIVVVNALPAAPAITASGPLTFCAGGNVTLTSGTGTTYLWSTGATTPGINVTSAGSYSVQVTNASGCQSAPSAATAVVVNALPAAPAITASGPLTFCTGGSVTLTSGAGTTYLWSTGATTASINITTSGSYTVQVTNSNGCQSAASAATLVVVNALPAAPSITASGPLTFCAGSSVNLTSSTGTTYLWSTGATTASISVTSAGSYTVRVTNASSCQSAVSTATVVTVNALPAAPLVGSITQPACFESTGSVSLSGLPSTGDWTITRTPGGVTTPGSGQTAVISVIPAGSYTFTVTNSVGCTSPPSPSVVIQPQPLIPEPPTVGDITSPTCLSATGSVVLSGLPSSGTWTLTRYPGTVKTTGSIASVTISGLAAGTYNYTVANAAGCVSSLSENIEISAQPATPAAPVIGTITQPTCSVATGSVAISGLPLIGNWTITRNPGGTTTMGSGTSIIIAGIASGTYTFTVTNSLGCTSASSTSVGINSQPVTPTIPVAGTVTQPTCSVETGSVAFSGLPAGNWTLTRSPGGATTSGTGNTITVPGLATGTYTFTVTNAAGCTSAASASVVINAQPASPSVPVQSVDCSLGFNNAVVTVTGPTGAGLEYSLDGNLIYQASNVFTGVTNGNHFITVRNAAGCTTAGVIFSVSCGCAFPTSVTLSSNSGSTCGTTPVTVSGNSFGGSATSVVITENGSGSVSPTSATSSPFTFTYTPVAADAGRDIIITVTTNNPLGNPCNWAVATYTLTVNANPAAPTVGTIIQPTCSVATGSVLLSGLPAGNWTLTRNPGGVTTGSGTSTTISGIAAGTYTFTLTNSVGCTSVASANVVVNAQPATPAAPAAATITHPTCTVATGSIILSGLPAGNWIINPGAIAGTGSGTTISGLASGTYNFTVTNAAGCTSLASANMFINSQPVTPAAPTPGTITHPTCALNTGSVVLSGLPTGSWTINPGAITGSTTSATISGLASGTYSYTVTNAAGCTSPLSVNVVINAQPATPTAPVAGTITQPTCAVQTGSVILTGLPAGSWTINSGAISGSTTTVTVSNLFEGTYTYTVTNAAGCISVASANVVINAQPVTSAAPVIGTITQPTCTAATGSVVLNGLPAGNWTINPGGISGSTGSRTISGLTTGSHNYTVTNAAGCTSLASANVVINAQPVTPAAPVAGTITQPTCAVATGSVVLSGLPSGTWTINPVAISGSSASTSITGLAAGTHNFTVTNSAGCTSLASANVVINPQPVTPAAPTTGTITHPTCVSAIGSIVLTGLPSGNWTVNPGAITGSTASTLISGLVAGTYNYTVTNAVGCTSPSTNVVINAQPVTPLAPTSGTITHPTCTSATGSIVLTGLPSGNWTINPGAITGSTATTPVSGLVAGTYNYTVTNAAGCTSPASANIIINAQPVTPAAPALGIITHPTCFVSTGTVAFSGLPATGDWTITRSPGGVMTLGTGPTTVVSVVPAGTFTYTVTNSVGCTSPSSASAVIQAQPLIPSAPVVGEITPPSCLLSTGSAALNGLPSSGTWTLTRYPGTVKTTGSGTGITISGLAMGTYNYTVANAAGCVSAPSENVEIPAQPVTPTAPVVGTITQPTCSVSSGSVAFSGLPLTGNWTITRNPGGAATTGSGTSTTITGIATGTYTFTVTNSLGCTSVSSTGAVINSQPVTPTAPVTGAVTQPTCSVATGSVAFSGLPAGNWTLTRSPGGATTSGTGNTTTVPGLPTGAYTYTVTNSVGCTSAASASVVINAQPASPSAPVLSVDCTLGFNNAVVTVLSPTGAGLEYSIDGNSTYQTGTIFTGVINGNHLIAVRNSAGCTTVGVIFSVTCGCNNPTSVTLSSNSGSTCGTIPVTVSGNSYGGSATSVIITENGAGSVSPASATSSPFNFTYTPAAADAGRDVIITVTTNNPMGSPCSAAVATYTLTVNANPAAPTAGTFVQPTCSVTTGSVLLNNLSSTGTWTLARTPGGTTTGTGTSTTIPGLAPGTYTFVLTNSVGCTSAVSANVVINAQPPTPAAPVAGIITQTTCSASTGSVVLNGLPPTGTWTVTRTPGAVSRTGTGNTITITPLPADTYTFIVTNSEGCISPPSSEVTINSQPVTPAAPSIGSILPPSCSLSTGGVTLLGLPSTGTYTLTRYPGGATSTGTGTSTTITGLATGPYNYTVTNSAGCISVLSANVVIPVQPATPLAPLVGIVTQPTYAVPTGSVVLSGLPVSGSWTLTRSPGDVSTSGTGATGTISNLEGGNYTFTVTNTSGCTSGASADILILAPPGAPTLIITDPATVCSTETVDLTVPEVTEGSAPNLTYTYWTDAEATIPYETPAAATEGTYYIRGTSTSGFFTVNPVIVTVDQMPEAFAGNDQVLDYLFETNMDAEPGFGTGVWSVVSGSGDITDANDAKTAVSGLSPGENIMLWTITNGVCPSVSDQVSVTVNDLIIPTLITPNGDALNEYFELRGIETLGKTELNIFDRRGARVYNNPDYDNTWNGVDYNSNPLPDDTYFFVLKSENGTSKSGYIVIRR